MPRPDVEDIERRWMSEKWQWSWFPEHLAEDAQEDIPLLVNYVRELEAALEIRQQCPICNAHVCIDQETGAVITAPR